MIGRGSVIFSVFVFLCLLTTGDRVVYVDVLGGGKRARGREGQILGDGGGRGGHGWRFVAAVDGDGQGAASREAVLILGLAQEHVLKRIPYAQLPHGAEAAVQGIGIGSVGVEGERAVQPRLSREGSEADGQKSCFIT